jgi:O-antigen/teichoic acid export membrane protein
VLERTLPTIPTPARALAGLGWQGAGQAAGLAIRFVSNVLLARLLAPAAYGTFGTAMAVVVLLELVSDLGIWPSVARHPRGGEPAFVGTAWRMGVARGLAVAAVASALAWPLAAFYREPALGPILVVLALRPALLALRSPGMLLARRELDYRPLFVDEVGQTVVGTAVALAVAWATRSVWAIVAGTVAGAAAGVAASGLLRPMRVPRGWDRAAARDVARLGRQVVVNTAIMALGTSLDRLVGARLLTAERLGPYVVALNLAAILEAFLSRACDVYFAALSRCVDPDARARWHGEVLGRVARWGMPAMALGAALSPAAIAVLYDARYAEARPLMAILVARLMFVGLARAQFQYLLSLGEIRVNTLALAVACTVQAMAIVPLARALGTTGLALSGLGSAIAYAAAQALLLRLRGDGGRAGPLLAALALAAAALLVTFALR